MIKLQDKLPTDIYDVFRADENIDFLVNKLGLDKANSELSNIANGIRQYYAKKGGVEIPVEDFKLVLTGQLYTQLCCRELTPKVLSVLTSERAVPEPNTTVQLVHVKTLSYPYYDLPYYSNMFICNSMISTPTKQAYSGEQPIGVTLGFENSAASTFKDPFKVKAALVTGKVTLNGGFTGMVYSRDYDVLTESSVKKFFQEVIAENVLASF